MKDDLTIEKLKINERLGNLEVMMGKVFQSVDELKMQRNEVYTHIQNELEILHKIFYGTGEDGKPGILLTVDRLKIAQNQRAWQIGIVYTVVVGLALSELWHFFFH